MKKIALVTLFFALILTGCLEIIQLAQEHGQGIEFATTCEKGKKQKLFTSDQPIFLKMNTGSRYISRYTYRRKGEHYINFKYKVGEMPTSNISLKVPQDRLKQKGICLPLLPQTLSIQDKKRLNLLKELGEQVNGTHTITLALNRNNRKIKGDLQLDFTQGNGRYGKLVGEIKVEIARIKAEKERKARKAAARRKKIIDDYYSATDLTVYTITNSCAVSGKIGVVTDNRLTYHAEEIPANGAITIKARVGNNITLDGKTFATITNAQKQFTVCIKQPKFKSLSTRYSGNDAWKNWNIATNKGNGSIATKYSGNDGWKSWKLSLPGGKSGSLSTKYSGNDAWKSWRYSGSTNISVSTKYSGKDGWKSWHLTSHKGNLSISTKYSGNDGWKNWRITGRDGSIELSTKYSGNNGWKSWRINDRLEADPEVKMVALFVAAIYSGGVRNGGSSSGLNTSHCSFKGKRLYGKVKVVTSFPDIKVQVVNSFPDLKVQKVTSFPSSCGKWQFVDSFPDFTIQYVSSFPDVKVKFVSSFPGTN